ncbi:hypothetical protein CSC83_00145 [Staphylococcus aureus]|nr:hypothetical protein CMR25_09735 [Staphylococcus aureus]PCL95604.1 hypothetical protein CP509_12015 [Staphylococcus aureus]PHP54410.1 hypothetical protein CRI62_11165 [Staphylococcus aureus]PHP57557.1 hypothetical protein CRI61_10080 [Staphylococcus aureus]PPJ68988.1 hypothetical protein CSC85_14380 [Staphylococcus aureus]
MCRLGCGPQHREFRKEILQAMQVGGPQHREFQKRNSTGNASWRGPNTENFEKKFYRQCKLGCNDKEIFFLYHTMSHSLSKILK